MKQKVVIRVQMESAKKRSKAMKVAVGLPGVVSAAIEGADKNIIVVVGDGVDSVTLATQLRKHMGFAQLISVSSVEEKKEEKKPETAPVAVSVWPDHGHARVHPTPHYYYVSDARDPPCCIL